jgi:hypothetical protein
MMNMKERLCQNDPTFLSNIITGVDTWVCRYYLETEHQPSQCKSHLKVRQVCSNVKSTVIVFFILSTGSFTMYLSHRFKL